MPVLEKRLIDRSTDEAFQFEKCVPLNFPFFKLSLQFDLANIRMNKK